MKSSSSLTRSGSDSDLPLTRCVCVAALKKEYNVPGLPFFSTTLVFLCNFGGDGLRLDAEDEVVLDFGATVVGLLRSLLDGGFVDCFLVTLPSSSEVKTTARLCLLDGREAMPQCTI